MRRDCGGFLVCQLSRKRGLLLLFVALILAGFSARDAALAYWRGRPASAPAMLAADPVLAIRQADHTVLQGNFRAFDAARIGREATAALRVEPLDPVAMRLLGMAMVLRGQGDGQALFFLAERLSRRDLQTQFLLIENSARQGSVSATLAHYDRALSVHPEAGRMLYPVLAKALTEQPVRAGLADYAGRRWFPRLIASSIAEDAEWEAVTGLLEAAAAHRRARDLAPFYTQLLRRLIKRGAYPQAAALVERIPGGSADALRQIGFSAATADGRLAPLSWRLADGNEARAELPAAGGLDIRLAPDQASVVAERVTLLSPGTYAFTQTVDYERNRPAARLLWDIRCLDRTASVVWRQGMPLREGRTTYRSRFTVPPDCRAQRWQLKALAAANRNDSSAHLGHIVLESP